MAEPLAGKVVLVAGGTGALGAATCRSVVSQGGAVAFTYWSGEARARALSDELLALGGRVTMRRVECCDQEAIAAFVTEIEKIHGRIDVLVNAVGAIQPLPLALLEERDWNEAIRVNLTSAFLFAKTVARGMIRRKSGVILNVGSIAGHRMLDVPVHYAAAKAGVIGLSLALAKELSRHGIRVNAVSPGLVDGGIGSNVSDRQVGEYERYCALRRRGRPEEVAELLVFLASDRASYVNAQNVVVDGGL